MADLTNNLQLLTLSPCPSGWIPHSLTQLKTHNDVFASSMVDHVIFILLPISKVGINLHDTLIALAILKWFERKDSMSIFFLYLVDCWRFIRLLACNSFTSRY